MQMRSCHQAVINSGGIDLEWDGFLLGSHITKSVICKIRFKGFPIGI